MSGMLPIQLADAARLDSNWYTRNALVLPSGLSLLEWAGIGENILFLEDWSPWGKGDWWEYGKAEFGIEAITDYLEWVRRHYPRSALSRKRKTFVNYARVCRAYAIDPASRCRDFDNFWHCEAAMSLPEDEREEFLRICEEQNLTARMAQYLASGKIDADDLEGSVAEIVSQNGRLREQAKDLSATLDVLRAEVDELRAQAAEASDKQLRLEAKLAARDVCPECGWRWW